MLSHSKKSQSCHKQNPCENSFLNASLNPVKKNMLKGMFKGTIALDIDKTITDSTHLIPDAVASYLSSLHKQGFAFIFVTGREFVYAMNALSKLDFPFFLGVQNGADLLQMPEKKHIKSVYFNKSVVLSLERLFHNEPNDFLLYAGYEKGDFCYFKPHKFKQDLQTYLKNMQRRTAVPWKAVDSFSSISQESFSMIKAIGKKENFVSFEEEILKEHSVEFVIIKDPKSDLYDYLLITDSKATKGNAITYFMEKFSMKRPLIACGDDYNDVNSLELADIAIAMQEAPAYVKSKADIIAPSCEECGIIAGLKEAISRC